MLGTLPDLLTGIACLVVWISPFAFGQDAVKTAVLMMLMEFLMVHGTGFFTGIAFMDDTPPRKRLVGMAGMLFFYAIFIAAFASSFKAWWPAWVFAWLVISKALWIFISPRDRNAEMHRQMKAWAFSTTAYLAAVFMGVTLPAGTWHHQFSSAATRLVRRGRMDRAPAHRGGRHGLLLLRDRVVQVVERRACGRRLNCSCCCEETIAGYGPTSTHITRAQLCFIRL